MLRPKRNLPRRGFFLMEICIATVIIGLGVLSIVQLMTACTRSNNVSATETTGMLLASNIQECMAGLTFNDPSLGKNYFGPEPGETLATYNDTDDFDGLTFNPPIDSTRTTIPNLSAYTQVVSVAPVPANQPGGAAVSKSTYTGVVRIAVKVLYQPIKTQPAKTVYECSWMRVDIKPQ